MRYAHASVALFLLAFVAQATAQTVNLKPESQAEFDRVYGNRPDPSEGVAPRRPSAPDTMTMPERFGADVDALAKQAQDLAQKRSATAPKDLPCANGAEAIAQLGQDVADPLTTNSPALLGIVTPKEFLVYDQAAEAAPATPKLQALQASQAESSETVPVACYFVLWHLVSLDVTAIDHRRTFGSSPVSYHEQFGPPRSSRAIALVHLAMFEAANAVYPRYNTTLSPPIPASRSNDVVAKAAIVEAGYQMLNWLYPGLKEFDLIPGQETALIGVGPGCLHGGGFSLKVYYTCSLQSIPEGAVTDGATDKAAGRSLGREIAGQIIAMRSGDGSALTDPVRGIDFRPRFTSAQNASLLMDLQQWQTDPVSELETALGGHWMLVRPFAMTSAFQFRPDDEAAPAPEMPFPKDLRKRSVADLSETEIGDVVKSAESLPSYRFIDEFGRDGRLSHAGIRQINKGIDDEGDIQPGKDGFFLAQLWAYDGTANLCAPVRLYNQVAGNALYTAYIGELETVGSGDAFDPTNPTDIARYFALINLAMFDASIAAWDAKYYFQFPRPVTYIRAVDDLKARLPDNGGTAPEPKTGEPAREPTELWFPVGAQNTNSAQPFNVTPPFPAFPSGHAVFGGALFGIMRQYFDANDVFMFRSDEFNGRNRDVFNYVRCERADPADPESALLTTRTPERFCNPRPMTLNCAERENADSRLWMGVHWAQDADVGIAMGNKVARQVFTTRMQPTTAVTGSDPSTGTSPPPFSVKEATLPAGRDLRLRLLCPDVKGGAGYDGAGQVELPQGWQDKLPELEIEDVL